MRFIRTWRKTKTVQNPSYSTNQQNTWHSGEAAASPWPKQVQGHLILYKEGGKGNSVCMLGIFLTPSP